MNNNLKLWIRYSVEQLTRIASIDQIILDNGESFLGSSIPKLDICIEEPPEKKAKEISRYRNPAPQAFSLDIWEMDGTQMDIFLVSNSE